MKKEPINKCISEKKWSADKNDKHYLSLHSRYGGWIGYCIGVTCVGIFLSGTAFYNGSSLKGFMFFLLFLILVIIAAYPLMKDVFLAFPLNYRVMRYNNDRFFISVNRSSPVEINGIVIKYRFNQKIAIKVRSKEILFKETIIVPDYIYQEYFSNIEHIKEKNFKKIFT